MFKFWMVWRILIKGRAIVNLPTVLAMLGLALGVACLLITLAVISGYESTLKATVQDSVGHMVVLKRGSRIDIEDKIDEQIKEKLESFSAITPFVLVEAIMAKKGYIQGVLVEGLDTLNFDKVLSIHKRLIEGKPFIDSGGEISEAWIGKGIRDKFDIKLNDEIKVVLPSHSKYQVEKIISKVKTFKVVGVLDLGRHDYDNRYIVTDLHSAQEFSQYKDAVSGYRLRLTEGDMADIESKKLEQQLGYPFWVKTWRDANRNIFAAAKYEKAVIFCVLLVIIIAAAFNVSSTLYISVSKKFHVIGIIKAVGGDEKFVKNLFVLQGVLIGGLGSLVGVILGALGCLLFTWVQTKYGLIPSEIYKLNIIYPEVRASDFAAVLGVSLFICYISTLAPARKGARLLPVEGIRYE